MLNLNQKEFADLVKSNKFQDEVFGENITVEVWINSLEPASKNFNGDFSPIDENNIVGTFIEKVLNDLKDCEVTAFPMSSGNRRQFIIIPINGMDDNKIDFILNKLHNQKYKHQ